MDQDLSADLAMCVAVGSFNPAILAPGWIVKQGILPDGKVEITSALGPSIPEFRMEGIMWRATSTRLEAQAERPGANPGEFVAQVFDLLTHTPVRAVGNNFQFGIPDPAAAARLFRLAESRLLVTLAADQRAPLGGTAIASVAHDGDGLLQVSVEFEKELVTSLSFNFHRDCSTAGDAAEAARRWEADRLQAARITEQLLRIN